MIAPFLRSRPFAAAFLVCIAATGCTEHAPSPLSTVRGRVFLKGKPVEKANVKLVPIDFEIPDTLGATPASKTDEIGAFYLIPGVPPGKYRVAIEKPKKASAGSFPSKYSDPATSGFTVDIVPGSNELPTFELVP